MSFALITLYLMGVCTVAVPAQTVTSECLRAICHLATTKCLDNMGCVNGDCGPFKISRTYWDVSRETKARGSFSNMFLSPIRFEQCANNYSCAAETVKKYVTKFAGDCNGDGLVDCSDFGVIHFNGGCNESLNQPQFVLILPTLPNTTFTILPSLSNTTSTVVERNASVAKISRGAIKDSGTGGSSPSTPYIIGGCSIALLLIFLLVGLSLAWYWSLLCFAPKMKPKVTLYTDPPCVRNDMEETPTARQERATESYLTPVEVNSALSGASRTPNSPGACLTFKTKHYPTTALKPKVVDPVYQNTMFAVKNQNQAPANAENHEYLDVLDSGSPNLYSNVDSGAVDTKFTTATSSIDYDYVYDWQRFPRQ